MSRNRAIDIDIFGIQNTTQQGADNLAVELGAQLAMPDFFRGKPWELSKFPPPNRDEFLAWIGSHQWRQIEPDVIKTIGYLRELGAKKIGIHRFSLATDDRPVWILLGRENGDPVDQICERRGSRSSCLY